MGDSQRGYFRSNVYIKLNYLNNREVLSSLTFFKHLLGDEVYHFQLFSQDKPIISYSCLIIVSGLLGRCWTGKGLFLIANQGQLNQGT